MRFTFFVSACFAFSMLVFSCSTFHSNFNQAKPVTGRDLPPVLIRDLAQMQLCDFAFWQSPYGQQSLLNREKLEKSVLVIDAERKPVCNLSQGVTSVQLMNQLKNRVFQELDSKTIPLSAKVNLVRKVLLAQGPVALGAKLTQGEVLLELILIDGVMQRSKAFKNSELARLIEDFGVNLQSKQDEVLKNAFRHDAMLLQSETYRSEIYDLRGKLGGSDVSIPTQSELDELAKFNKYAEIMKIENFKNEVLENFECIKSAECQVCENRIEKKTCGVAKTNEQLREENSVYLQLISQNLNSAFNVYYKRTNELIALSKKQ